MAESTLSTSRSEILQAVGDYFEFGRNQHSWSREETAKVTRVIRSGERQFYEPPPLGNQPPHSWSFMRPRFSQILNAPYSTGVVGVTTGTVTLTGGTWPTWAADGWLVVDGAGYTVASRSSSSVLVLDDTAVTGLTGETYSLQRYQYTLPDDFGGFIDPYLSFSAASNKYSSVLFTTVPEFTRQRQFEPFAANVQPTIFTVQPVSSTGSDGQRFMLQLFPTPTVAATLEGTYYSTPSATTDSLPYPLGGQPHSETYMAAIMAAAEFEKNKKRGDLYAYFLERLATSIAHEKKTGAKILGYNGDGLDDVVPFERSGAPTYNGVAL